MMWRDFCDLLTVLLFFRGGALSQNGSGGCERVAPSRNPGLS